jgi:hypothetical protein
VSGSHRPNTKPGRADRAGSVHAQRPSPHTPARLSPVTAWRRPYRPSAALTLVSSCTIVVTSSSRRSLARRAKTVSPPYEPDLPSCRRDARPQPLKRRVTGQPAGCAAVADGAASVPTLPSPPGRATQDVGRGDAKHRARVEAGAPEGAVRLVPVSSSRLRAAPSAGCHATGGMALVCGSAGAVMTEGGIAAAPRLAAGGRRSGRRCCRSSGPAPRQREKWD